MAIALANQLGTSFSASSGLSSFSLTVGATTTAHNRIIVAVFWGASNRTSSVSDSQGNNYSQDVFQNTGVSGFGAIFSGRGDNVLTSGTDTITVTWTGGTINAPIIAAYEFSGLANFSPLDKTNSGHGSSSSPNSGSVTTAFNNELVFGAIGWDSTANFTVPGYTQLDKVNGSARSLETQYQIESATGSYAITGTLAGTPGWASMIATYADTANGAKPSNTTAPAITGSGVVGMQITCSQGLWSNIPTSYSYQWQRGGVNVATGAHYLVTTSDVGHVLSCIVTATNKFGSVTANASNTITPAVNSVTSGLGI